MLAASAACVGGECVSVCVCVVLMVFGGTECMQGLCGSSFVAPSFSAIV